MTEAVPQDTPSDANAECVGPTSEEAGKSSACAGCPNQGACSSGAFNTPEAKAAAQHQTQQLQQSLSNVSHVILVLSGKGGVGKSTVAAQICHTLASQGYAVGLLDVDLCGPSAPRMVLGDAYVTATVTKSAAGAWTPVYSTTHPNLACMSISFLLKDPNAAVVWRGEKKKKYIHPKRNRLRRFPIYFLSLSHTHLSIHPSMHAFSLFVGPRKNGLIQQFLTEVDWTGDTDGLDYLIVDTPPGTSDEHISTVQYLQKAGAVAGAVLVTTPEEISMADVRKEINFCQKTKVPLLGLIENMGQYTTTLSNLIFHAPDGTDCTSDLLAKLQASCPEALEATVSADIFPTTGGGPKAMATQYDVPYWGILPLDPNLLTSCEQGKVFVEEHPNSPATKALKHFCEQITSTLKVDEVDP